MKTTTTLSLAAALLLGSSLQAQQPTKTRITFEEAITIALKQNLGVRQAANAQATSATTVRQQKLAFLPDLRVSTSSGQNYGRAFNQTEGQIVDQTISSMNAGVSSSLTVFDGMKNIANLAEAKLAEEASSQDVTRARQTAAFTVASNFLSIVAGQEQLRVQEENFAAQDAQREQIDRLVKAGRRSISDLYSQQASVASARAAVVEARNALELSKVDLMQTLQLDAGAAYEFVAPTVIASDTASPRFSLDSLLARALARRPDLSAEVTRVDAAKQAVRAASGARLPTVSVSAGYNTSFSTAADLAFSDQLDQRRSGSLSLGVSVPLWDRGSASLAAQRAEIQADNARLSLTAQRQTVALEVRRAWLAHEAAKERLAAAEAQRAAADQAANASQQRYQAGASTLVELTQARSAQVQAASALVSARYALVFQQSLMSYYTGDLDPTRVSLGE